MASKAEAQLERMLADLRAGEFIYEQPAANGVEYVFKHALTQDDDRPAGAPRSDASCIWLRWPVFAAIQSSRIFTQPGRPDPADPTKTIQPTNDELVALIGQVIRLARHEAMIFGLDAPSKMEVAAGLMGPAIDKEEIDIRLARLTQQERDLFMMLIAKMDGRWVEPPAIEESGVETTATTVQSDGAGS